MIVVDTNVIAALYLPTGQSAAAEQALQKDPVWAAPMLWRSEFRNVLVALLRREVLSLEDAIEMVSEAEQLMREREYAVPSDDVLSLSNASGCTAYDCEFVSLARWARTSLVTLDQAVLRAFPEVSVSLARFVV